MDNNQLPGSDPLLPNNPSLTPPSPTTAPDGNSIEPKSSNLLAQPSSQPPAPHSLDSPSGAPSGQQIKLSSERKSIQPISMTDAEIPGQSVQPNNNLPSSPAPPSFSTTSTNPVPIQSAPEPTYNKPNIPSAPVTSVQPSSPMVGSQLPSSFTKQKKSKVPFIKGLITLFIIGGISIALLMSGIIPLSKFKNVTYDNGKGETYNLKFYSRHSVKNVTDSLPNSSTSSSNIPQDLMELASKKSVNGKTPIIIWIMSAQSAGATLTGSENLAMSLNDCTQARLVKLFDIHMESLNQDVAVCAVSQDNKDLIYIATFHDEAKKGYMAYVSQDVDFKELTSSQQAAKDGLAKLGLQDYQEDIKTILASIDPVSN